MDRNIMKLIRVLGCVLEIPQEELAAATAGFSKGQIGEGAFGRVYKAIIHGGTVVAIKVLRDDRDTKVIEKPWTGGIYCYMAVCCISLSNSLLWS